MILNNIHRERRELLFRIIKGEVEKFLKGRIRRLVIEPY